MASHELRYLPDLRGFENLAGLGAAGSSNGYRSAAAHVLYGHADRHYIGDDHPPGRRQTVVGEAQGVGNALTGHGDGWRDCFADGQVGCCALAPVAMIGETIHGNMAPSKVEGLFTRIAVEKEMAEREKKKNEA